MTTKKEQRKKKSKMNLSKRRKISFTYYRASLFIKLAILVFGSLFIFTGMFSGFKNSLWNSFYQITSSQGLNYTRLRVEGNVNVSLEDIAKAVSSKDNIPIFSIDLMVVKNRLDANAWVSDSIVQRRLPDTIFISLFERKPIAIWQFNKKLYIIDSEGDRISGENIDKFPNLIRVIGEGANINAAKLISDLETYPDLRNKAIMATRFGDRRWDIVFDEDITVRMPEEEFDQAYNYLQKLHKKGKLFGQSYKMFDLRVKDRYSFEKFSN